jgi:hypothetical protein
MGRKRKISEEWVKNQGRSATIRTRPPVPSSLFTGKAMRVAPLMGSFSALTTYADAVDLTLYQQLGGVLGGPRKMEMVDAEIIRHDCWRNQLLHWNLIHSRHALREVNWTFDVHTSVLAGSKLSGVGQPIRQCILKSQSNGTVMCLFGRECAAACYHEVRSDNSAGVAQLVEHLICNQRVGGSIPSASSI